MQKLVFGIAFMFAFSLAGAQDNMSIQQYINTYKDIAINEMKRTGVPAAVTLAQGILETENGNSDLVRRSNNHFGIKCKSTWTGDTVFHDDDLKGECFRKYDSASESYRDHSNFLRENVRYSFLFRFKPTDYKSWAYGLKKAGYATNPQYPHILIRNIEDYNLNQYTLEAMDESPFMSTNDDTVVETSTPDSGNISTETASLEKRTFNGLNAILAPAGTSLLAIATRYNISLSKLLEYNDLKTDGLLNKNSWIYLEKKWKQSEQDSYTTQGIENVYDIAQGNGLQLSYLLKYNELGEGEELKPGTTVRLKPRGIAENSKTRQKVKFHIVRPKEGLYVISKRYNVSIRDLKAWNNLRSDNLRVGQKLIISK